MKVLVAGIGNVFLSDDAFGVDVVGRLMSHSFAPGVEVVDVGIRGVHLAYQLLDGYDALVLIDAMPLGEVPGTLALVEADLPDAPSPGDLAALTLEAHSMTPAGVLGMLAGLGGRVGPTFIVGCQPESVDEGMGLSPAIAAAVEPAATMVIALVDEVLVAESKEEMQA
jgi:hydrogenase maturation protease